MAAFQNIINTPPSADSLKVGADKINANFGSAVNSGSGVLTIDQLLPIVRLEHFTPPQLFFLNSLPSDLAEARKVIMSFNGIRSDLSPIEQLRLEVLHPDSPSNAYATEARMYMTMDALGSLEALRIMQNVNWATSGLAQFVLNYRPYYTDTTASLAVIAPIPDVTAKFKITTPEMGGTDGDGINFSAQGTDIILAFGTPGPLNIPRSGNGSGNIYFKPRGAGIKDYVGVNTQDPLNYWAVANNSSPSMSLQALYWDSLGPHTVTYDCRATDGTLGAMGWEQLDYPATPRKARWFATASTGVVDPDIKIELEENNVFFTAPGVTREGLRNEERLSKVNYINILGDFPTSGGDIWFTEGTWDANNIPFTITQDIYINKGVTVRNLNITTGNYIEIGDDASTDRRIRIENSRITFTGSGRQGLIGGDSKATAYAGFDLELVDCSFFATAAGKFINLVAFDGAASPTANVMIDNCRFDGGCPGTFFIFDGIQLSDITIKNATSGFLVSDIRNVNARDIVNEDTDAGDGYVGLCVTELYSGAPVIPHVCFVSGLTQREGHLLYIQPINTGTEPIRIKASIVKNAITTESHLDDVPDAMVKNATRVQYPAANLTGYISEGQAITGVSSGATGYVVHTMYSSAIPTYFVSVLRTSAVDFSSGETVTTATGSAIDVYAVALPGADQTHPQVISRANIGIPDSTAYIESSVTYGSPAITILPATEIRRINAAYVVKKAERFEGVTNGNLKYTGLDPIAGTISFDMYALIGSGTKSGIFYPARGNVNNTVTNVIYESPGVSRVITSQDHGYSALDTVLLEGTTLYDGSYQIVAVPTSTSFTILKTYTAAPTPGEHYLVVEDSPYFMRLSSSAIEHGTFSRTVEDLKNDDIIFLCGEIVTGDNLSIYSVAANFVKGS